MSRAAKGADCKSAGYAFAGSSPASPTIFILGRRKVGGGHLAFGAPLALFYFRTPKSRRRPVGLWSASGAFLFLGPRKGAGGHLAFGAPLALFYFRTPKSRRRPFGLWSASGAFLFLGPRKGAGGHSAFKAPLALFCFGARGSIDRSYVEIADMLNGRDRRQEAMRVQHSVFKPLRPLVTAASCQKDSA